jgi:(1->4)-alpha-D-glucan 1-alpha-D-glucosylmutase
MTLARSRGWQDTSLTLPGAAPGGPAWTDVLTGRAVPAGTVRLDALLSRYPVALLVRGEQ